MYFIVVFGLLSQTNWEAEFKENKKRERSRSMKPAFSVYKSPYREEIYPPDEGFQNLKSFRNSKPDNIHRKKKSFSDLSSATRGRGIIDRAGMKAKMM